MPNNVKTGLDPDVWFEPRVVLEVAGAELTLSPNHKAAYGWVKDDTGIGIRFPRYTGRLRDDKSAEQSTSVAEVHNMYEIQYSDGL